MSDRAIANKSIVMVGASNTGKSHFTFQLFGRLSDHSCKLRLREMPNLELFKVGLEQLNKGLPAEHTNADKYDNADLRIAGPNGEPFDLLWPDYGGEQIRLILENRGVDEGWKKRLESAEGILLFLRLQEIIDYKNIVDHPLDVELTRRAASATHQEPDLSSQIGIVEMLQILMWAAQKGNSSRLRSPKLGVLLSCWDELGVENTTPSELLRERAPLLEQFVRANWTQDSVFVLGLSSLERPLNREKYDEDYVNKGPESFGYIIQSNGHRDDDLTIPLLKMLELIDEN
ncbi:hypothetical protein VN12_23545 [Pirellula sp. SH-Sr6A]|uniref:TRAFAC clade GTPase domain-containing protein n=1 Tax=Pirellula sp. SH-Sr6A TaxID=1632865 RepID=UPI00078D7789|nr:hypothetical protein [Pirellula sp. SH-Sr6A]AMV35121.1 hypothetical protein VN12_23545 [Pirellula sp. SH-Sr6A]